VELLNKIASGGLQIWSRFTRSPHLFSPSMVSLELVVENVGKDALKNVRVGQKVSFTFSRLRETLSKVVVQFSKMSP